MRKEAQEAIKKQLAALPPKVYSILANMDFSQNFRMISQKYALRTDQSAILEDEVMLVLLGLEHPDVFVVNLRDQGHLPQETAAKIAIEINDTIFKMVRHELAEFHEKNREQDKKAAEIDSAPAATQHAAPPPPAAQTPPGDFAKSKLEGSFRLPAETTRVEGAPTQPAPTKPAHTGADPYREPIK